SLRPRVLAPGVAVRSHLGAAAQVSAKNAQRMPDPGRSAVARRLRGLGAQHRSPTRGGGLLPCPRGYASRPLPRHAAWPGTLLPVQKTTPPGKFPAPTIGAMAHANTMITKDLSITARPRNHTPNAPVLPPAKRHPSRGERCRVCFPLIVNITQ